MGNYITIDGLQRQLDQHPAIPQIVPVAERYVRVAKSIIKTGQAEVNDSLSGEMPFELVLEGQWTQIPPGNYAFTLYDGQTPLDSVLVKAFRHSDRVVVSEAYTDANGRVGSSCKCRPVSHRRSRDSARRRPRLRLD